MNNIVEVHNPFDTEFSVKFDGKNYSVPAFGKLLATNEVAEHIAHYIAQRILVDKMKAEDKTFSEKQVDELAVDYIKPVKDSTPEPSISRVPNQKTDTVLPS